jgi:Protein of unknown function (DUF2608)
MTTPLPSRAARAVVSWYAALVIASCGWAASAAAGGIQATKDFAEVAAAVDHYVDEFGPRHVLLVVDIDNTLLAMNQDLGSDQWFEWQRYLLDQEPQSDFLVGDTFEDLLATQGLLYNLGRMHPPQRDLPVIIAWMQGLGVHTLVLTSRGDEYRVATEREMRRNDYDFTRTALPFFSSPAPDGTFLPYDAADPKAAGFTSKEIAAFDLTSPRPVSYSNGIYMTAGQQKGAMLLALLHRSPAKIKAIVFADDHMRHCAYVFAAAAGRGIEITAFNYQREEPRVQTFQYGDKEDVHRRWRRLSRTLEEVFD